MVSYLKNISERIFHDTEEEEKKNQIGLLTNKNLNRYFQFTIWNEPKALHVLSFLP